MTQLSTSVVLYTYNRWPLLKKTLESILCQNFPAEIIVVDDGSTDETPLAKAYPVRYLRMDRKKPKGWLNPARTVNAGIRAATGDIIVLNCAEVKHMEMDTLERLTAYPREDEMAWAFAEAYAQTYEDSDDLVVYVSDKQSKRPISFCGALRRKHLLEINGFDEDFTPYPAFDDDDLADRLINGLHLKPIWTDVPVLHQWHPHFATAASEGSADTARKLFSRKQRDMQMGLIGPVRNIGRDWGALDGD